MLSACEAVLSIGYFLVGTYDTLRGYEVYRKLNPLLGGSIILEGMIFAENFQISRGYYYFRGYISRKLPKGPLGTSFKEGTFIP